MRVCARRECARRECVSGMSGMGSCWLAGWKDAEVSCPSDWYPKWGGDMLDCEARSLMNAPILSGLGSGWVGSGRVMLVSSPLVLVWRSGRRCATRVLVVN